MGPLMCAPHCRNKGESSMSDQNPRAELCLWCFCALTGAECLQIVLCAESVSLESQFCRLSEAFFGYFRSEEMEADGCISSRTPQKYPVRPAPNTGATKVLKTPQPVPELNLTTSLCRETLVPVFIGQKKIILPQPGPGSPQEFGSGHHWGSPPT